MSKEDMVNIRMTFKEYLSVKGLIKKLLSSETDKNTIKIIDNLLNGPLAFFKLGFNTEDFLWMVMERLEGPAEYGDRVSKTLNGALEILRSQPEGLYDLDLMDNSECNGIYRMTIPVQVREGNILLLTLEK